jgi:hypothetical protein
MPRAPTAQTVFPFCDHPEEVPRSERPDTATGWDGLLLAAFAVELDLFARKKDLASRSFLRHGWKHPNLRFATEAAANRFVRQIGTNCGNVRRQPKR